MAECPRCGTMSASDERPCPCVEELDEDPPGGGGPKQNWHTDIHLPNGAIVDFFPGPDGAICLTIRQFGPKNLDIAIKQDGKTISYVNGWRKQD